MRTLALTVDGYQPHHLQIIGVLAENSTLAGANMQVPMDALRRIGGKKVAPQSFYLRYTTNTTSGIIDRNTSATTIGCLQNPSLYGNMQARRAFSMADRVCLYLDEDAQRTTLVRALRARQVDILTATEAGSATGGNGYRDRIME